MRPIRTNYLINPQFQLRFIRFVAISCTAISVLTLASQFFFTDWLLKTLQDANAITPELATDLDKVFLQALIFTSVLMAISLFVILACSLIYSHRIAGPIFKMKKCMDEYLRGEERHLIYLRDGDYLVDLAHKINDVMKHNQATKPKQ